MVPAGTQWKRNAPGGSCLGQWGLKFKFSQKVYFLTEGFRERVKFQESAVGRSFASLTQVPEK